ncbi:hypothetical protein [Aquabacterium humicola]|uniref:hypothetical protein n=1 Tax=Aquabacterium humicola TaxID=3237377 RepID=UPI002543C1B7|nr:hypothetical protein [Rubrivivax pictus]
MSSPALRSLLVHLDTGRHAAARLDAARLLAGAFEARLQAMLTIQPTLLGSLPLTDEDDAAEARFEVGTAGNGPGRARELLLGGATFTVLNEMSLPVLLAH